MKHIITLAVAATSGAVILATTAISQDAEEKEPVKALLVTGGGYHDYDAQKVILSEGVSERAAVEFDIFQGNADETRERLSQEGWADDYDVIVYNLCHAHESNADFVEGLAETHSGGKAAVVIHCAMHSYHWKIPGETKFWPATIGVTSPRHGKHAPITVENVAEDHPIMEGFPEEWTTPEGELYHIDKFWETATVLAQGTIDGGENHHQCVWVNEIGEGRVFGTTLGHHNSTMETDEYLDLVTRGLLWTVGGLDEEE